MAVFTDLSDNDRDEIAAAFGLLPLISVIGIADGDTETTYLFRSRHGEFIITLFESGAEPFDLERAFQTMETLSMAGIPCPTTLRAQKNGAATIQVSGKLVAAVSFVAGSPPRQPNIAKCTDLGSTIARMHQALMPSRNQPALSLPRGPIHGALSLDNVFFVSDVVSGIINFRLRHDEVLVAELADVLVAWTMYPDGSLDEDCAQAIVAGYTSVRSLEEKEWDALPVLVVSSAARLMAGSTAGEQFLAFSSRCYTSAARLFARLTTMVRT
ncbi:phosphotransferase [Pararhizobium sp. PWRC1-1]|uniref:phosphotransferase n=1 Tax=Pararhizobium sp. PWRC1-1 TaxID=2804566 RepID=UPI003CF5A469